MDIQFHFISTSLYKFGDVVDFIYSVCFFSIRLEYPIVLLNQNGSSRPRDFSSGLRVSQLCMITHMSSMPMPNIRKGITECTGQQRPRELAAPRSSTSPACRRCKRTSPGPEPPMAVADTIRPVSSLSTLDRNEVKFVRNTEIGLAQFNPHWILFCSIFSFDVNNRTISSLIN